MTFPTVAARNVSADTSQDHNYHATLAAHSSGDLLIVAQSYYGGRPFSAALSGWTKFVDVGDSTWNLDVFWKYSDGTEGTDVAFVDGSTNAQNTAIAYVITGASGSPEAASSYLGSTSNPDPPSLSPSWGAADTLWLAIMGRDDSGGGISGYPSGYSNGQSAGGFGIHGCYSAERQVNAASEDPGAFTAGSSGRNGVATIAIKGGAAALVRVQAVLIV